MLSRLVRWNGQSYGWRAVSGGFAAMPDTVHFTLFLSAAALLAIALGPDMIYVLARTISRPHCGGEALAAVSGHPDPPPPLPAQHCRLRPDAPHGHPPR